MRIFQVINSASLDRGGAERLTRALHLDLLADGHDAWLVALEANGADGLANAVSLGLPRARDPRALLRLDRWLAPRLRDGDIVHAHLFPTSAIVATLRRLRRIRVPCIFTEHSTFNRRRATQAGRALDRAIYPAFARIAAISEAARAAFTGTYPLLSGRTCVVRNGATLHFRQPPPRGYGRVPTILSAGRLTPVKNIDGALRALARVRHPFRYSVLGDGPERARLIRLAADLGLAETVEFPGHQRDIVPWLREADLFLMPSRYEGFGLAAVEAMNAALPVIAGDVPGLRDIVPPTAGRHVPPDDPARIAAAVETFLAEPETRHQAGRAAFEHSLQFSRDRTCAGYLDLYRDVLGHA